MAVMMEEKAKPWFASGTKATSLDKESDFLDSPNMSQAGRCLTWWKTR